MIFTTQPTNVVAGTAISPAVVVTTDSGATDLVTISIYGHVDSTVTPGQRQPENPLKPWISGTTTVAASGSTATFNNLIINVAGNFHLAAQDATSALTSANVPVFASNVFTVYANSGAQSDAASGINRTIQYVDAPLV